MDNQTIAFLHHEHPRSVSYLYLINYIRKHWEDRGARVVDLFGVGKYEPADVLFVHVDLSVVPSEYSEFAGLYPKAINRFAENICKTAYLSDLVTREADYDGKVIVKTDLNYGGVPEFESLLYRSGFLMRVFRRIEDRVRGIKNRIIESPSPPIRQKADYKIFDSVDEIPDAYFSSRYVVQKFQPEMQGDLYVLRKYYFLDEVEFQKIGLSEDAFHVNAENAGFSDEPVHEALRSVRQRLCLDYGKIDYALVDGEPRIYDANKTCGVRPALTDTMYEIARRLSLGL